MDRFAWIPYLLLIAITPIGCGITQSPDIPKGENKVIKNLKTITLTPNDLPSIPMGEALRGHDRDTQPQTVDNFFQRASGLMIKYHLFASVGDAQQAADKWRSNIVAAGIVVEGEWDSIYQPEPSAEDVIGDATWRAENTASLWILKNNVVIYVKDFKYTSDRLSVTRAVARKIVAKIDSALTSL